MKKRATSRPSTGPSPVLSGPANHQKTQRFKIDKREVSPLQPQHWTEPLLFGLFLLSLLTPLIYNSTTFFGYITGRTIYFRLVVELMALIALLNGRIRSQPLTRLQRAVLGFGLVLALSNALGVDPSNSFLSGYSRMEGFLAYVHYSLYFLLLSRISFSKNRWNIALLTAVSVSVAVVLYGSGQASGWQEGHYRLVAIIGNPSYLGLYLLLNVFLLVHLFGQFAAVGRIIKSVLFVIIAGVLCWGIIRTGARSAVLGLLAGIAVFGTGWGMLRLSWSRRAVAVVGLTSAIVLGGALVWAQGVPRAQRPASIQRLTDFSPGENTFRPRYLNWKMALAGIADRPLLGWGQENYGYGFARHYDAALFAHGTITYDRTHNLFLEVGFSSGLIGLLAYVVIWICLLGQLQKSPLLTTRDRLAWLALLIAYLIVNSLNFDSLVSAQLFFMVLALLDTTVVAREISVSDVSSRLIYAGQLAVIGGVVLLGYFTVNSWQTVRQINRQVQATSVQSRADILETAYRGSKSGQTEVADILVSFATTVLTSPDVSFQEKNRCYDQAVAVLQAERKKHPENTRLITRLAGLYTTRPDLEKASALYDTLLHSEAQRQPHLWFLAGTMHLQHRNITKARSQFREAYIRQPTWQLPLIYEAVTHSAQGDTARARSVMNQVKTQAVAENFAVVRSLYMMNRDTTGLLNRLDRTPYDQRNQYMTAPIYQDWAQLAFDTGNPYQVSVALLSYYFAHTDRINKNAYFNMVEQAKKGLYRPEGIETWLGTK